MKIHRLILPTLLGLALAVTLLFAAVRQSQAALVVEPVSSAQNALPAALSSHSDNPQAAVRFVATSGVDSGACTDSANPCRTVQYAVDRADAGDEVRVARGTYTEVNDYGGLAQVIYLTKTVTIQGGYNLTNWITPDPENNLTVLDAQGLGQVVYITGTVSSTLSGMRITGGQPHGIRITNSSVTLTGNQVYGNSTAGIRVDSFPAEISAVTLEGNTLHDNPIGLEAYYSRLYLYDNAVQDNGAPGGGRGAYLFYSQVTLQGNLFTGNQGGGGIEIQSGTATLISNTFISNSADLGGGAISIAANEALLEDNTVLGNTSGGNGGGIYGGNSLTLRGNRIGSNTSAQYGGGVYLLYSDALLEENILLDNSAGVMGGGLFSSNSSPQLLDNHLENNRSSWGGGAMLTGSPIISGNIFLSNTAQSIGGGLLLDYSDGTVEGNIFRFNAGGQGGGMYLNNSPASLANNVFTANASDQGGGIYLYYSNAALNGNKFEQNNADQIGGGLYLLDSHASMDSNLIVNNSAGIYGGGMYIDMSSPTLTNNIVAENYSAQLGSGILINTPRDYFSPVHLIHNSFARNTGGDGSGVVLAVDTDVMLSNTIIVSQAIGIDTGTGNNTAILEGTLWGSSAWANGQDWVGEGIITGTVNIWGDPGFIDPDGGDYHISQSSAALDAGIDADVYTDIDGEPRPAGAGFDIGADELQAGTRYVATTGVDSGACTDSANPCRTVQYAVDQAVEGDEVHVASGVYSDIHIRPRQDITTTGYVTQVVYISKTISIQGGYSLTNWTTPDPTANPVILDAQGLGRVVYITGLISPSIDGLHATRGNSTGLGGIKFPYSQYDQDAGGGIFIHGASATISNLQVISNTSPQYGGGIHLSLSTAVIYNNDVSQNSVGLGDAIGGGLSAYEGTNVIIGNVFSTNQALGGGGYYQQYGESYLRDNVFISNTAQFLGGAIYIEDATSELINNLVIANTASSCCGGGLYLYDSSVTLRNNLIHKNTAPNNSGGGIEIMDGNLVMDGNIVSENYADATGGILITYANSFLVNNIIVDNHSVTNGSGVMIWGSDPWNSYQTQLLHNTIARNDGDVGAGVLVATGLVTLTNNIIVSQTIGVYYGGNVSLEGSLWGSGIWANGQDWDGNGTIITGTVNVWGDPGFVDPDHGNYHIRHGSAAVDAGIDAGVYTDIDGEPRPAGAGFDIGADELQAGTRYVATTGVDSGACTDSANPCRTVQYAVDQAVEGDEVHVASGVYSDIHLRPRQDITTTGYVTQVVYISKTISIQGGYSLTNWTTPDPTANPAILDAQGLGRVVYITGLISPTIEGFQITGDDASGLGGKYDPSWASEFDAGGGIYVQSASAIISDLHVIHNTFGGGLHLSYSAATIENSVIAQNNAGGISAYQGNNAIIRNEINSNQSEGGAGFIQTLGDSVLVENRFFSNTANGAGGAIFLDAATSELIGNQIEANTAVSFNGGALFARDSNLTLHNNIFFANSSPENSGGGLEIWDSSLVMDGNIISNNFARTTGGILLDNTSARLINNLIIENDSASYGAGIAMTDQYPPFTQLIELVHNTIARNTYQGEGGGVVVASGSVSLTNNTIVSHTTGILVYSGGNANLEGTLWGSGAWANGQDWAGNGTIITGTVNVWGDPAFVDPDGGDYHISFGSAALDAGVEAGVYTDIDGEPRPVGAGFDIGADELQAALHLALSASPDPVASGDHLTYTLILTNTGVTELHAIITATLPAHVTPGGSLTWTSDLPPGGNPWTENIVVTVDPGYAGPLTSTLEAISLEGAREVVTNTVTAIQPVSGLATLNSSPSPLGQPTTFTAALATGSGVLFEWDFGDGTSGEGQNVEHTYPAAGIYTATVTANNAVSDQSAQAIVIVEEAIAGLSIAASSPTVLGQTTVFTATVGAGSNVSYTWDFGDGASGSGAYTTHTYTNAGEYTATVTAFNLISGISTSTTARVTQPDLNLYLPIIIKTGWTTDQPYIDLSRYLQLLQ